MSRSYQLTAVGLPLREELLVRSLLLASAGKTRDQWRFSDGLDVQLALCNPESALSRMATKRAASDGLICVSVLHEGMQPLAETESLHAPIRSADFIELLNHVSAQLARSHTPQRLPQTSAPSLLRALAAQLAQPQAPYWLIEAGNSFVVLDVAHRRCHAGQAPDAALLQRMLRSQTYRLEPLDTASAQQAISASGWQQSFDQLAWLAGAGAERGSTLDLLRVEQPYRLRRWPDAGRIELTPAQMRMAAHLSRQPADLRQLAELADGSINETQAFLNACAVLDLLEVAQASATPIPLRAGARRSRYTDLFQSIRHVLGMRNRAHG